MKKNLIYILLFGFLIGFGACKKSELQTYKDISRIYFYRQYGGINFDSSTYSFAVRPDSVTRDTMWLPMRIMGIASNTERTAKIDVVADSSTAIAPDDYELLPVKVAANSYTTLLGIVVHRSSNVQKKEVRIRLAIGTNTDFSPGVANAYPGGQTAGGTASYLVKINNTVTKPGNWDDWLVYFFGDYSEVKYRFVIQVTGQADFPDTLPIGIFSVYQSMCQEALDQYMQDNGPLIDENGKEVSFY
ncbi:DUF4843 domain-containing protein [Chitinophaga sp. Cy-1792]|uniref:DUF4843 domain-containing protein n=1 Tax=Chitinophaga sp. Cy-1792 TaxID=2608339 RepID=UPI00141EC5BA|nr:DUF4843 domain-containing protein [Chitinophaga sp. Cy-1792]